VPCFCEQASGTATAYASRPATAKDTASQTVADYAKLISTDNYRYYDKAPCERVDDKMVNDLSSLVSGALIIPKWEAVAKHGLAGTPRPSQEKHITLLAGAVHMLYVRFRMTSCATTTFGVHDENAAKYMEQTTDSAGQVVETERKWFFDHTALQAFNAVARYPLGVIKDDKEREDQCIALWSGLQSACTRIGTRTLTTIVMDLVNGPIIKDIEAVATKQAFETPRRAPAGAASTSGGSRGSRPTAKTDRAS